jgi:hypothetical protein
MRLLYGRAGRLAAKNGGFPARAGVFETNFYSGFVISMSMIPACLIAVQLPRIVANLHICCKRACRCCRRKVGDGTASVDGVGEAVNFRAAQ